MLEKQQKNKKEKKLHAVFYQVGFILILYGENAIAIFPQNITPSSLFYKPFYS
jgi:hypothetical protein